MGNPGNVTKDLKGHKDSNIGFDRSLLDGERVQEEMRQLAQRTGRE
jgi:hypothetical protein